ncbi:hypothetical protein KIPB_013681 [Kipferlia bialata]|uniref:Uncharacterized protein n=1 Tax=Kipferlia bialata TaxID=797122 RepID=A0A391NSB9_9EUKA|nr:hypothetical protein KIPB_013681 [Kipferlia bialata]|eukprot:g13681.t1
MLHCGGPCVWLKDVSSKRSRSVGVDPVTHTLSPLCLPPLPPPVLENMRVLLPCGSALPLTSPLPLPLPESVQLILVAPGGKGGLHTLIRQMKKHERTTNFNTMRDLR